MDFRSIVLYRQMKGMNGRDIYHDLVTTLHEDALPYSRVTLWPRQERLPRFSEPSHNSARDPRVTETDQAILSTLIIQPFGSVRDIARLACVSCSTIHSHLRRSLELSIRHLYWIPHVLIYEQELIQVSNLQALLRMLQTQRRCSWQDIVTLDEFWLYANPDHERIRVPPGEASPDRD
jgi:hypothetical protein